MTSIRHRQGQSLTAGEADKANSTEEGSKNRGDVETKTGVDCEFLVLFSSCHVSFRAIGGKKI